MRQLDMRLKRFVNAVVMLLVAAGLLLAPLACTGLAMPAPGCRPRHAGDVQRHAGDVERHAGDVERHAGDVRGYAGHVQRMPDDMPCCPDQTQSKDCGSCPFVALCMLTFLSPPRPGCSVDRAPRAARAFAPIDDLLIDGLGDQPPDHPPRTDRLTGASAPDRCRAAGSGARRCMPLWRQIRRIEE